MSTGTVPSPRVPWRPARLRLLLVGVVLGAGVAACTTEPPPSGPTVPILAQLAGRIAAVEVAPGDRVRRGTVLVRLDGAPFEAATQAAEAELVQAAEGAGDAVAAAARTVAERRAAATRAQAEAQRVLALAAADGASKQDADRAVFRARAAQIEANGAEIAFDEARRGLGLTGVADARVVAAATAFVNARHALDAVVLSAGQDGRVARVLVTPGAHVTAGALLVEIVPDAPVTPPAG